MVAKGNASWRESSSTSVDPFGRLAPLSDGGGGGGEAPLRRANLSDARLCSLTTLPTGLAQPE